MHHGPDGQTAQDAPGPTSGLAETQHSMPSVPQFVPTCTYGTISHSHIGGEGGKVIWTDAGSVPNRNHCSVDLHLPSLRTNG